MKDVFGIKLPRGITFNGVSLDVRLTRNGKLYRGGSHRTFRMAMLALNEIKANLPPKQPNKPSKRKSRLPADDDCHSHLFDWKNPSI